MGGPGSGNHGRRTDRRAAVEDCLVLDANRWARAGILAAGVRTSGRWGWSDATAGETAFAIGYEAYTLDAAAPWLRLRYAFTGAGTEADYRVRLTATRPQFGGRRWWVVCPLGVNGVPFRRRVGKLYPPPGGRWFRYPHVLPRTYCRCQESRQSHNR